jgi:hypothetical protein
LRSRSDLERWVRAADEPSLVWRWLTEVEGRPGDDPAVVAARSDVPNRGGAQRLLAEQLPAGNWVSPGVERPQLYRPKYIATTWKLIVLSELGATRSTPGIQRAAELMLSTYAPAGELGGKESEVCFTGNMVRTMANLGYADDPLLGPAIAWLVASQKADGGWNCFPSDTGTLDGWEALAAFAALPQSKRTEEVERAIRRGAEFYLDHFLLEEGPEPYAPWRRTHYPTHYYYDYLVGLDFLTRLGFGADERMRPALDLLESRRNADGTWNLDALHPDLPGPEVTDYQLEPPYYPFVLEPEGRPSRWITVTALGVLRRAGRDT